MKYETGKPRDPRFIQMLIDEYQNTNISLKDLSMKYHTDAHYQFKLHNIPIRTKGQQRILTRKGCFQYNWKGEEIKTEEQAYIAGLLLSDGYVGDLQMGLRLKKTDKELLTQIKDYFCPEITLQEDNKSYTFVISSMEICENFTNLGIPKRKTGKDISIPVMDKSLLRHFIRGYFDGDGSVFKSLNGNSSVLMANICCVTPNLLEEMQAILIENSIGSRINKENRKGRRMRIPGNRTAICSFDMYRLFVRAKEDVEKFYHFMYDDCHIYLERKRKVFEDNENLFRYSRPRKVYVNTELTA